MRANNLEKPNYNQEIADIIINCPIQEIGNQLTNYHENDIASTLPLLTKEERSKLYAALDSDTISEIFTYLDDVSEYLSEIEIENAAEIIQNMDSDDAVDALEDVGEKMQKEIVALMDKESNDDINLILSYNEDEIGSIMTTNFIKITKDLSVKQAMRELVNQAKDNDNITTIYVVDSNDKYYGSLDLKDLIIARDYVVLDTLISKSYPYLVDHDNVTESLERIKDYAEDSIPVLDSERHIIGVVTSLDVIEVVDDEMGEDYARLAGLTAEEDLKESLIESMKKRMPWLLALLLLGMAVSSVVGIFESVVSQVAIIVCFQSLILDMAGNVGTQSLAVTIRVLMDEELKPKQKIGLMFKEMKIGCCNGLILGILSFIFLGLYICVFKGYEMHFSFAVSGCVGIALVVAMIISSLVGTVIPMFFHKIKIDPAVASGPLITTINDLVAVITYYGLAWLLLINILGA